jgi:hypothetical protein
MPTGQIARVSQVPPQWRLKKLTTYPYPIFGSAISAAPSQTPTELTKYAQTDFFSRLLIQVTGNIAVTQVGAGTAGTATGRDNPEALLTTVQLDTQPQLNACTPVKQLSARGLLIDSEFMRGYVRRATPLSDDATSSSFSQAVDILYEVYFKRPYVRKGAEYDHAIAKYASDLLTTTFGGKDQLFTGGAGNTWNLSGLTVSIWADSDLNSNVDRIHNVEFFERTYPITASQTDFPIDTLPQGYLYSDLYFLTELDNVLTDGMLNNIDIEGGARVWLPQGDGNASILQRAFAEYRGVISDPSYAAAGIIPVPLRDGMFTKSLDALASPITIKLDVTFTAGHSNVIRLIGRKMVPGAAKASNPRHLAK